MMDKLLPPTSRAVMKSVALDPELRRTPVPSPGCTRSAAPRERSKVQTMTYATRIAGPHRLSMVSSCRRRRRPMARKLSQVPRATQLLNSPVPARAYRTVRKTSSSAPRISTAPATRSSHAPIGPTPIQRPHLSRSIGGSAGYAHGPNEGDLRASSALVIQGRSLERRTDHAGGLRLGAPIPPLHTPTCVPPPDHLTI